MTAAPDPVAWAAREVGLEPSAPPPEVRAALLRDVTRDGFAPPPARRHAWQVLCAPPGSRPPCPPEALLAEEARLRGEVEDFASGFFAVPVGPRRRRWQELAGLCAFSPPLAARLAAFLPGLDLDLNTAAIGNPRTEQMASHVAGLFVLAPAARAAQRQAVARGMQGDIAGWEAAARQLQSVFPALAALEPALLASVLTWRGRQQRLAKLREGRGAPRHNPARRAAAAPAAPASSGWGKSGCGLGGGGLFAAFLVVRVCIGFGAHSSSHYEPPDYAPPPKVGVPDFEQMERERRQREEVRRMLDERDRNDRPQPGEAKPWDGGANNDPRQPRREDRPGTRRPDPREP